VFLKVIKYHYVSCTADSIRRYDIKLWSAVFLQRAEYVYRRFDRMCCLHLEGAGGIDGGIEKKSTMYDNCKNCTWERQGWRSTQNRLWRP